MSMSAEELREYMDELGLNIDKTAEVLGVSPNTVGRWLNKIHPISNPVATVLRLCLRLKRNNLTWNPHVICLSDVPDLKIDVDAIITALIYSGSTFVWEVDREKGIARGGNTDLIEIGFRNLEDKRFYPITYRVVGKKSNEMEFSRFFLEDAIYAYYSADPYDRFPRLVVDNSTKNPRKVVVEEPEDDEDWDEEE